MPALPNDFPPNTNENKSAHCLSLTVMLKTLRMFLECSSHPNPSATITCATHDDIAHNCGVMKRIGMCMFLFHDYTSLLTLRHSVMKQFWTPGVDREGARPWSGLGDEGESTLESIESAGGGTRTRRSEEFSPSLIRPCTKA